MPTRSDDRAAGTITSSPPMQHLSWSSVQTYARCPKMFQFRYFEQAPEERTAAALAFGGAIHKALELIHQHRMEGRMVPEKAALMAAYDSAWTADVKDAPELVYSKGEDASALRDLAGRMIDAYMAYLQESTAGETIAIEHEALFRLIPDAPPIKARVDLVEIVGDSLIVTDWKTSRCRWSDAKAAENLGQLITYIYLLLPMLKALGVKRVVPRFIVLTKGKSVKVQVVEPAASQADAAKLKERVAETWSAIEAGAFPRRESWACTSCPYRTACLGS